MNDFARQLEKADRLAVVTQSVGFALWQLQELEGVAAQYFVLLSQAEKGMGSAEGNALVEKAQSKTFGATIRQLGSAGLLTAEIEERFRKLLEERNWLVHHSRSGSRAAVHDGGAMGVLIARLEAIAEEALALLKHVSREIESFGQKHGISSQYVDKTSKQLLAKWHAAGE